LSAPCACHTPSCRFTDVKQLFYQAQREAAERKGGREAAAGAVQMPDIAMLHVNYRTHRRAGWLMATQLGG
jgi:hypothetical protein